MTDTADSSEDLESFADEPKTDAQKSFEQLVNDAFFVKKKSEEITDKIAPIVYALLPYDCKIKKQELN